MTLLTRFSRVGVWVHVSQRRLWPVRRYPFRLAALFALLASGCATSPSIVENSPAPVPIAVDRTKIIAKGALIHEALKTMVAVDGWTLEWYPAVSWRAIATVDFNELKDASAAAIEVITILREEGKPVSLRISDGNKVMEVLSTEVQND